MPSTLVIDCAAAIAKNHLSVAFIESATAGRMCSEFALTPYSGKILRGGISCYEVFVKEDLLKVPHDLIAKYTPESAEVTAALAASGAKLLTADVTVAITGLTTAGGSETEDKPVGTMFVDIRFRDVYVAERAVYSGSPESIILQCIDRGSELILNIIS